MITSRKVVKVFIASPNDLGEERVGAKAIVDEFNSTWAGTFGYHVELVGWEDVVTIFGRPQSVINKELEGCEYFIGLMWKSWGTPPDSAERFTSGFEEEFEISVDSRTRLGKPEISLFFKDIQQGLLQDPGEDLKKVIRFKDRIITEKKILFETFRDAQDFQFKFRRCISNYVKKLRAAEAEKTVEEEKTTSSGGASTAASASQSPTDVLFQASAGAFIADLVAQNDSAVQAAQVARFRLLGQVIGVRGNDDRSLGVHDANLIFSERENLELTGPEISGLLDAGFENFSFQNCPVWYWVSATDGFRRNVLRVYALYGPTKVRRGAIEAMALIAEQFESADLDRTNYIRKFLSKDSESEIKVATLRYLEVCGISADVPLIREELNRADYNTRSGAVAAILHISLRDSRDAALAALFDLQPESVDSSLLQKLFADADSISTEILLKAVTSRIAKVRLIAVSLLKSRKKLADVAEKLIADSNTAVRLEGLLALAESGKKFSAGEPERVLVRRPGDGGGLFGLAGGYDREGNKALERFRFETLKTLPEEELNGIIDAASPYEEIPYLARVDRHFDKFGDQLRSDLKDQFHKYFEASLARMARSGWSDDMVQKAKSLGEFLRGQMTRKALSVICKKSRPEDLILVRELLKDDSIPYSEDDAQYLKKHGEWSDIALIIKAVERQDYGSGAGLLIADDNHFATAATAIYQIGKNRLGELLALPASPRLLSRIILIASDKNFRALTDLIIQKLYSSEADDVRKAAALKCVKSFPRARLKSLLADYTGGDNFRYYNVVHWLDFGISVPVDRISASVLRAIQSFG